MSVCADQDQWTQFLNFIKKKCSDIEFQNWLSPIKVIEESEKKIVSMIKYAYPDHAFLSEEGNYKDATSSKNLWIIDPLDGTNNYEQIRDGVKKFKNYLTNGDKLIF